MDNLFANLDSYTLSARNYYLYQNTTLGRWQWIKWDCNETFGSYAMGVPGDMTELGVEFDGGNYDRPLLERILANENLKNAYLAEMCELRELYFNSEYLDPRLDAIQALIQMRCTTTTTNVLQCRLAANFDNNLNTADREVAEVPAAHSTACTPSWPIEARLWPMRWIARGWVHPTCPTSSLSPCIPTPLTDD